MPYFAPYLDETGLHLPTYAERMEDLTAAYRRIFSPEAALTPETPDYQLLSAFARALDDVGGLLTQVYLSRSPAYARGARLDLLCPLYGMTRRGESRSSATLVLSGTPLTQVPAGSCAADTAGVLWKTRSRAVIGPNGTARVPADCELAGPVTAPAGSIRTVVTAVSGWTGVNNPEPGGGGLAAETDSELRRRMAGAFHVSAGPAESIAAGLLSLPGVADCSLRVNDSNQTEDSIPAHSIAAAVLGGNEADIARMLFDRKAPGIGTWGDYTLMVRDAWGSLKSVSFSRPRSVPVTLTVRLSAPASAAVQAALEERLRQKLLGLRIGETLYLSELIPLCEEALSGSGLHVRELRAAADGAVSSEVLALPWNGKAAEGGIQFAD